MAKLHGDFGDLSRYDVARIGAQHGWPARERYAVVLVCRDCDRTVAGWSDSVVPLDNLTRAAAEHETAEEQPDG